MSKTRVIFIGVAAGAAVLAGVLAKGFLSQPAPAPAPVVQNKVVTPMTEVLVVRKDMIRGEKVTRSHIGWRKWPKDAVSNTMVSKAKNPKGLGDLINARARIPLFKGEPVSIRKFVKPGDKGFMAAMLPKGRRAISVRISAATGAGGFILPNDRVDVLVTRKQTFEGSGETQTVTEMVLSNVRVLAIDQSINTAKGKDDNQTVVGKTATLELEPVQAEVLAKVETTGQLTLILRSLADSTSKEMGGDRPRLSPRYAKGGSVGNEIKVFRYGVQSLSASNK